VFCVDTFFDLVRHSTGNECDGCDVEGVGYGMGRTVCLTVCFLISGFQTTHPVVLPAWAFRRNARSKQKQMCFINL
jgi:hypothetical protein